MSDGSSEPGSGGTRVASIEELHDFTMIAPAMSGASPLAAASLTLSAPEKIERFNASIVVVLTLACTLLAVFDLFLLALGT